MANGVTFAGQPAVLDVDETIEKFVAERWPASRWPFSQGRNDVPVRANPFGPNEVRDRFALPYPDVPAPRINELIIPTGASRYGRGLFLFGKAQMAAIAASVWGYSGDLSSLPESWGASSSEATLQIEYGQAISTQMYALPPVLIDGSGSNELWLLPLVDSRYLWRQMPAKANLSQNDSWSDLFENLGSSAGITLTPGSINSAYGQPDRESFADPGVSVAVAIDAAALSIGARVVRPFAGGLTFSTSGAATSTLRSSNLPAVQRWMGGETPRRALPKRVSLIGRKAVDHFGHCGESVQIGKDIGSGSLNTAEVIVHTPWWVEHFRARADGSVGYLVDSYAFDEFDDLAGKIASDVAAWGAVQYGISAPGVVNWTLTGHDDYLSVRVGGLDNLDSVSTHIQSLPPDFAPLVQLGQRPYVYVHPNDSAVFTLLEDVQEDEWAAASILKMGGFYDGADIRQILIRPMVQESENQCTGTCQVMFTYGGDGEGSWAVTRPCSNENCTCPPLPTDIPEQADTVRELPCKSTCSTTVGEGSQFLASYQCEQGWHAVTTPAAQCELPAWEIEATLDDVLYAIDESGEATFTKIRSVFPHSGPPPGVDPDTGKVAFKNPWRIDALCESKLILQRVPQQAESHKCEVTFHTGAPGYWSYTGDPCPDGYTCPPLPTDEPEETTVRELDCIADGEIRWELRKVNRHKARHIKFYYDPEANGDYTILGWWEGESPEECGEYPNIQFPLGEPCMPCHMMAFYDPITDSYQADRSPSAVLGEAEDMNVVQALAFDGCGVNYIRQPVKAFPCDSEPSLINTEPDLAAIDVLTGVNMRQADPPCTGSCRWEWVINEDDGNRIWQLTKPCPNGCECLTSSGDFPAPGEGDPWYKEFPCQNEEDYDPQPAGLDFSVSSILVCSAGPGSGGTITIPVTECPVEPEPDVCFGHAEYTFNHDGMGGGSWELTRPCPHPDCSPPPPPDDPFPPSPGPPSVREVPCSP